MRIGLAYDLQTDPADERQAEFDSPATIQALRGALETGGHQVSLLGGAHDILRAPRQLSALDLVFNIAEGRDGRCREAWVPTVLELLGIPYVGSDPLTLSLGLDKVMGKRLAVAEGILTPRWVSIGHPRALPGAIGLAFPLIVKPRCEGSGRGLDRGALVRTRAALAERARWLCERCPGPLLIEEFIPYGELTVCVIGNDPPLALPAIQRPIDVATRLASHIVRDASARWDCPLELEPALDARAREIAERMFRVFGCRDFARVDLRVDARGQVYFLEINPLPSCDPEGSFGLLAEHLGIGYAPLIHRVLDAATARLRLSPQGQPAAR